MKVFIKAILTCVIITIMFVTFFKGCTKSVTYKGVVLSHTTSSDKYGDIHYHTIASFDDGMIRSLQGFEYYIIPVGGKVSYTIRIMK